ncbi:hypothetical protein BDV97DRAFT_369712 [Delphinella strobiligena]|nr:hypothetical protein BDV97DRAFT_369712 [Delphinella strobiligena]
MVLALLKKSTAWMFRKLPSIHHKKDNISGMSAFADAAEAAKLLTYFPSWDHGRLQGSPHRIAATNIYKTKGDRFFHIHGSMNSDPILESLGLPRYSDAPSIKAACAPFKETIAQIDSEDMQRLESEKFKLAGPPRSTRTPGWWPEQKSKMLSGLRSGTLSSATSTIYFTMPKHLAMVYKYSKDVLFKDEFFEDRECKNLGTEIRAVKPVLSFTNGEVDLSSLAFQSDDRGCEIVGSVVLIDRAYVTTCLMEAKPLTNHHQASRTTLIFSSALEGLQLGRWTTGLLRTKSMGQVKKEMYGAQHRSRVTQRAAAVMGEVDNHHCSDVKDKACRGFSQTVRVVAGTVWMCKDQDEVEYRRAPTK